MEQRVPLIEAKLFHQYDHRWGTYEGAVVRDVKCDEKHSPDYEPTPHYWVLKSEVVSRLEAKNWSRGWIIGWRRNARSTDDRTLIATLLRPLGLATARSCSCLQ